MPSNMLIHPAVGPDKDGPKFWGELRPLFGEGSGVPILHKVAWAEAYLHAKYQLHPSSGLAAINMGRKFGGAPPFWGGERGLHLTQSRLGRGLASYQVTS